MKKRTICFINSNKAWGGGEKWHLDMAGQLKHHGYGVCIMARRGGALARKCKANHIPVQEISYRNLSFLNPVVIIQIAARIKKLAPHVVILNLPADLKTGGLAAKIAGVPSILYRRGSALPIRPHLLNRYFFKNILTGVIANSEKTKTLINHRASLISAKKVHVIYNGISIPSSIPEKKENKELIIGNAGRMVSQKGQSLLIDLALHLERENIDFQIHIAGDGPLYRTLAQAVEDKCLTEKVIFKGFQKDLHDFYSGIDIFVLPSHWEGFGYVMVEAMLYHTPVVAFNHSSNPEVVTNGETGYLVPPGRTDLMAERVIFLAKNRKKRLEMGRKAGHDAQTRFSLTAASDHLEKLLSLSL